MYMKVFMNLFFVTSIAVLTKKTFAQNLETITGYVKDSLSQKMLSFSTIELRFQGEQITMPLKLLTQIHPGNLYLLI